MAFCEQCGTQFGASAAFCSGCGRAVTALAAGPLVASETFEAPVTPAQATQAERFASVSEKWRLRFDAIEKAGGKDIRLLKWPGLKELTRKEQRQVTQTILINRWAALWAILLGPVYYLYLGLWRKAITLTLLDVVVILIVGMVADAVNLDFGVVKAIGHALTLTTFSFWVNIDYYRKTVLKQKRWW